MKKTSIFLLSLLLNTSLLQASSQEHQSMKCGASMDMKEKKVEKKSSMNMEQKVKKKIKEKSSSKCGAQHMKMSAGKCGTDN